MVEDWPVQFIPAASPLEEEAIERASPLTIGTGARTVVTPVLSAEHLVAIALKTGRPKDLARIAQSVEAEEAPRSVRLAPTQSAISAVRSGARVRADKVILSDGFHGTSRTTALVT